MENNHKDLVYRAESFVFEYHVFEVVDSFTLEINTLCKTSKNSISNIWEK